MCQCVKLQVQLKKWFCFTTTYLRGAFTAQKSSFPLRTFSVMWPNPQETAALQKLAYLPLFVFVFMKKYFSKYMIIIIIT